jgi:ribonuclease T
LTPDWLEDCVSVDIETAGPYPALYAMLSIGACRVTDMLETFYVEMKPDREAYQEHALSISGLSLEDLDRNGVPPKEALASFANWLSDVVPGDPTFVAFNAPFDWMFINDYFHRYYGKNPFGHTAIDIKAVFLGQFNSAWRDTSMDAINLELGFDKTLSHHALEDALDQAKLFLEIIKRIQNLSSKE